jgi:hypothetical protein
MLHFQRWRIWFTEQQPWSLKSNTGQEVRGITKAGSIGAIEKVSSITNTKGVKRANYYLFCCFRVSVLITEKEGKYE